MTSPLHVACSSGKRNYIKRTIESAPLHMLEFKDGSGKTPLILCIIHNQLECASLLLKAGVHVDNSDNVGQTALHKAAIKGFHRGIRLLLSYNSSCHQKDFFGATPLHLAAIQENSKCLIAMLKETKLGEIDIQDSSKKTPLHWCSSYCNVENTKLLIAKGANISIPDEDGKTPLHWAVTSSNARSLECVRILLEKEKGLIDWQDYTGRSALHLAVATGSAEVIRLLTGRDECNIDILDNAFCTSLHWAGGKGLSAKVDILLNGRACFTSADDNGASPLHYAAYNNDAKTVDVFLSRNYVCMDFEDRVGRTALIWASAKNATDVIKTMALNAVNLLFADKSGITALHAAALLGHVSSVELLLELRVPVDLKDKYGMTPLMRACEFGRSKTVKVLIDHHADIFTKDINKRLCLHWCALNGHAYLCQLMLQKGIKCDVQDAFGMTPLHYACMGSGYLNCVSVLLESNANPNISDKEGQMPLHWAVLSGHVGVVRLLCEYNADVNVVILRSHWVTLLDIAVTKSNIDVVQLLRHYGALYINEIEEIAANKIQDWFRGNKFNFHRVRRKKIINTRSISPNTNCNLLNICQQVVEAFNTSNIKRETIKDFSKVFSNIYLNEESEEKSNVSEEEFQDGYFEVIYRRLAMESEQYLAVAIAAESKAALVIQRAWKRYSLKLKFQKMRNSVKNAFKTEQDRVKAESAWTMKLECFCNEL